MTQQKLHIAVITIHTPHYEQVPFEVPAGWAWVTLGEIGIWQSGATPSRMRKDYYGGNIPWLKTGDLNDGIIEDIPEYITEKALEETSVKLNPEGSVLIAMYGATIGKIGILSYPATTNQACCACTDYIVEQKYLFYFLLANRDNFIAMGGGGAQPNISKEKIIATQMPFPPIEEQKRIVKEIERWLGIVSLIESSKDDLSTTIDYTKLKILDLAIHGKLVPQNPSDEPAIDLLRRINPMFTPCDNGQYGQIPQGWIVCHLGNLFDIVSAKRILKQDWKTNGVPFYRAREIVRLNEYGYVDNDLFISDELYEEYRQKYGVPQENDIMMSAVGTIGKTYIVKSYDKFYYKDASVLCLRNINRLNSQFFKILLSSEFMVKQMFGMSKGTTVDTITISNANNFILMLPPEKEQQRIVARIEKLFATLDEIQNSLEA